MKNIFINHSNLLIKLKNTNKYIYAYEIYYNISNNKSNCCNPFCKKYIEMKKYFLFDSYYCSNECRDNVYYNLHNEWFNLN